MQNVQLVTFQISNNLYGIDIMDVDSIVDIENIRDLPNSPNYAKGIFNLRGEIIPLIDLKERFHLQKLESKEEEALGSYVLINFDDTKLAIIIGKLAGVTLVDIDDIKDPPEIVAGIGAKYIHGIVEEDDNYLTILNVRSIFSKEELDNLARLVLDNS